MDLKKLGKKAGAAESTSRPITKGRVLQLDTDFLCYEVSDLEDHANNDFKRLLKQIDMKRRLAGAERVNAFITLGEKSGREEMATVKEYQENRDPDKPIKVRVRELRTMLANFPRTETIQVLQHPLYEADDYMIRVQEAYMEKLGIDSSVLMSGDKDLWMGQGWHCDPKTGRMYKVQGYGKTEYREVGNVKPKLVGEGTSWFWHQMIMGDTVDNIPGLEKIAAKTLDRYIPLKSGKARAANKHQPAGEAKAVAVLQGVSSDREAGRRVLECYADFYPKDTAVERFMEQAYLLWMQRTKNPLDVEYFLRDGAALPVRFTMEQCEKIERFYKRVNG